MEKIPSTEGALSAPGRRHYQYSTLTDAPVNINQMGNPVWLNKATFRQLAEGALNNGTTTLPTVFTQEMMALQHRMFNGLVAFHDMAFNSSMPLPDDIVRTNIHHLPLLPPAAAAITASVPHPRPPRRRRRRRLRAAAPEFWEEEAALLHFMKNLEEEAALLEFIKNMGICPS
ncbi:hypothetical protein PFICI_00520 [Pestalotiopsis fici W106-1]|uniref:Uncharacterized protein n=1 Tax=Pestalotiopsis fici (strain W106-1 / CGMCC3.15140) TaxID=1229662 RepID=W3XMH2_PESFW|nr:uncharacterized protein PFICI_00520 [Pestalotiopsis fici W106-1]ETS86692.1 hypothetical protein PFICI_00520 [Pestalotiopsis fici W106-1]